jgi:hypothetical protein
VRPGHALPRFSSARPPWKLISVRVSRHARAGGDGTQAGHQPTRCDPGESRKAIRDCPIAINLNGFRDFGEDARPIGVP